MKIIPILIFILVLAMGEGIDRNSAMKCHDLKRLELSAPEAPDTAYFLWKFEIPHTNLKTSSLGTSHRIAQLTSSGLICFDENGEEVWRFKEAACVIVVENRVIIGSGSDLCCLNLEDGSTVWKTKTTIASGSPVLAEDSVCFAPIAPDLVLVTPWWAEILGRLYESLFGCKECEIACHDIQTGEKTWTYHEDGDINSVAYDQGMFIVLLKDGRIYSLDKNTRRKLWQFTSEENMHGYPAISGHQIVFADSAFVYCLDRETGHVLWKFPVLGGSSPQVAYDRVLINSSGGFLYCIDEYTGELVWKVSIWHHAPQEFWKNFPSSPLIADGKVFVGSSDKSIYSFNIEDGSFLWEYTLGGAVVASPTIIDGNLFVPCVDGFLYVFGIDPETYFQKAQTYMEQKDYEKAQKYFSKACEWYSQEGDSEKVAACGKFIEITEEEIQKYSLISESVKLAEEYFNRGNEALIRKKYDNALEFFKLSKELYEKIDDRSGVEKCSQRIEYTKGRTQEEDSHTLIIYAVIIVLSICIGVILLKTKHRSK